MNDPELIQLFLDELRDLVESLDRCLIDLKSRPDDPQLINQVFRDLHTIKGNGGMFGFADLSAFIHEFETSFDIIRSGRASVTPEIIRIALAARDEIPLLVEGRPDEDGRRAGLLTALAAEIGGAKAGATVGALQAATAPEAPVQGGDSLLLSFSLTGEALALGVRPDLLLAEVEALGARRIEADATRLPDLEHMNPGECALGWTMELPPGVSETDIAEVFQFVDAEVVIQPVATYGAPDDQLAQAEAAPVAVPAHAPKAAPRAARAEADSAATRKDKAGAATVRVPADRLDAMMDAVGELVIVEARLAEQARLSRDSALMATAEQITRLAAGLREATMTMRMVPMRTLVGRFRRLVSELSDTLGKPVDFVVTGEDTELDKTLIEKIADPLVHILRNALDHGVETPDDRLAAGKDRTSRVELAAEHAGAEVLVHVRDDGKGLDTARIRAKAVQQGLISAEAQLSDAQVFSLIFEPGFSTATTVTELSGRGVGMDVVRRTIEGLRGTIDVSSALGQGTTITLRMPLTLAIIEGLLVEIADERYTLPMAAVTEIVELPADKTLPDRSGDFLDVRGQFVPFLRLRTVLECPGEVPETQYVVIVSTGSARVGIVVDRIIGTKQVVIKQMTKLHAEARAVSGATILGDGSVALILDVQNLVSMGRARVLTPPPAPPASPAPGEPMLNRPADRSLAA